MSTISSWNHSLFWDINHLTAHTSWAHGVMAPFALWGGEVLLVLILLAAWVGQRTVAAARATAATVIAAASSVIALLLNQLAAQLWHEDRPFIAMRGVTTILHHSADNSFPSDHSTIAAALAIGTIYVSRRWGVVACVVALFTGFSRIYAGVHFPLDVIAGLLIGGITAWLLARLIGPATRLVQDRTPSVLRPLLAAPAAAGGPSAPGEADRTAPGQPHNA